jgi:enoyl-CoA hydratase
MAYDTILDDGAVPVRTVTVNRPAVLNALDTRTLEELTACFHAIDATAAGPPETAVRCVILTGAGEKAFVAGGDLSAMEPLGVEQARRFSDLGRRLADRMETLAPPIIAAVNGFALGGGLELALACDFILAAATAKLGQPEVNVGVLPGFGGTQRLVRRVGIGRARQLIYSGEPLGAEDARAWGLVNEVVPPAELLTRARTLAGRIAGRAPLAVVAAKRAMRVGEDLPLERALMVEQDAFASLFGTADQKEGMRAFLEKRAPRWQGR